MTGPWGNPPPPEDKNKKPQRPQQGPGGQRDPMGRAPQMDTADLEAILRNSHERLRNIMPPSWGSSGNFAGAGLLLAVFFVIWLSSGIYRVQEGQIGVVLRFGEVTRTTQPGLRYHLPWPIETSLTPNVTFENRIEIGFRSGANYQGSDRDVTDESTMLTSDQNIVDLDFAVTWVIKDPQQFLFEIRDPENTVKRAAESAMREVVGQTEIQKALTEARDAIQRDTKKLLQQILDEYRSGVEIVRVELLRVNPPGPVVDAFNDVQRAEADRERLRNEAEAYKNKIIPEARGEAERMKNDALGYKQQVINNAKGEAERFSSVWRAYVNAKDVTAQRMYLETMETILRDTQKVIVNERSGPVPVLPLPSMMQPTPPKAGDQ
ncbi:MAG: FtsH protease activity modulator HflK [Bdellovibrionales bacterium]